MLELIECQPGTFIVTTQFYYVKFFERFNLKPNSNDLLEVGLERCQVDFKSAMTTYLVYCVPSGSGD
jgi:hypothetical protein